MLSTEKKQRSSWIVMFIGMQLLHTKDALPSITGDNGINKKKN